MHSENHPTRALNSVAELTRDFSVEVTPREAPRLPPLDTMLARGTRVFLTFLANTPVTDTLSLAARVVAEGMVPVPHLAARAIPDEAALRGIAAALAEVGVREVLVVAGSVSTPAGEYHDTMQVLRSGVLAEHGIHRVGVAGHPEGTPDIHPDDVAAAVAAKNAIAVEQGIDLHLVTQFCFSAEPIVAWERRIRAAGNRLPVTVGLPGLTSPAKLLKFGLSCGVGPSLSVLRKQTGSVLKLATGSGVYHPDETMLGLAQSREADPASLLRGLHFFPFGALERTAAWAGEVAAGRFVIEDHRLQGTA